MSTNEKAGKSPSYAARRAVVVAGLGLAAAAGIGIHSSLEAMNTQDQEILLGDRVAAAHKIDGIDNRKIILKGGTVISFSPEERVGGAHQNQTMSTVKNGENYTVVNPMTSDKYPNCFAITLDAVQKSGIAHTPLETGVEHIGWVCPEGNEDKILDVSENLLKHGQGKINDEGIFEATDGSTIDGLPGDTTRQYDDEIAG